MKILRLLVVVALLAVLQVRAAPVSMDLKGATVAEFAELVFKGILKRDYLLGPGLSGAEAKITLSIRSMPAESVFQLAGETLAAHGVQVLEQSGVLHLRRGGMSSGLDPGAVSWMAQPGATPGSKSAQGGAGQGPEVSPAKEKDPPDVAAVYHVKHRTAGELSDAIKLLGVKVSGGRGGSLLLAAPQERLDLALSIIGQLDRAPGLVDVRAVIMEYSEASEEARSFAGALSVLAGRLGVSMANGAGLSSSISFSGKTIAAVLSAIEGDSRFRQLAEPRLRVLDGAKSKIVVGSEFPVRGRVETDKGGNAVASIEYKQAGIVLELSPQVLERSILLSIKQQVSSVSQTTTSGIDSPTVNKREAETMINAVPGQLVVVGGLDDTRDTETRSGLSWLPAILQAKGKGNSRTQILLLLEVQRIDVAEVL